MTSQTLFLHLGLLAALGMGAPAQAAERAFAYSMEHPLYGKIGTYTDRIRDEAGGTRIESRLRVAVRVVGLDLYREESDRTEVWSGGRLQSMRSFTIRNGQRSEIRGEIGRDGFVISTPSGTTLAPKDIWPTAAWAISQVGTGIVFSTRSGKIDRVSVTGGETKTVSFQGRQVPVRHFRVHTESQRNKWEAWLDPQGVPIRFRSLESGAPIDFILESAPRPDDVVEGAATESRPLPARILD